MVSKYLLTQRMNEWVQEIHLYRLANLHPTKMWQWKKDAFVILRFLTLIAWVVTLTNTGRN